MEKPLDAFVKSKGYKDGRMNTCRACSASARREKYAKNPEKYRQAAKDWANANPEKVVLARKKYYNDNPERIVELRAASYIRNSEKSLAAGRVWYAENADYKRQKAREWYANNIERARASALVRSNASYAANPEMHAARAKVYRAKHKETVSAGKRKYKAAKRGAEGSHNGKDVIAIFERQRGLCANCKKKLFKSGAKKYHVDHVIPLARGGSNWPSNLQCLCPTCNMRKGAKDPLDWANENGRLL